MHPPGTSVHPVLCTCSHMAPLCTPSFAPAPLCTSSFVPAAPWPPSAPHPLHLHPSAPLCTPSFKHAAPWPPSTPHPLHMQPADTPLHPVLCTCTPLHPILRSCSPLAPLCTPSFAHPSTLHLHTPPCTFRHPSVCTGASHTCLHPHTRPAEPRTPPCTPPPNPRLHLCARAHLQPPRASRVHPHTLAPTRAPNLHHRATPRARPPHQHPCTSCTNAAPCGPCPCTPRTNVRGPFARRLRPTAVRAARRLRCTRSPSHTCTAVRSCARGGN